MKIQINTTSNAMKLPGVREQIEKSLKNQIEKDMPFILNRTEEIPSFITTEVGDYSTLLNEATKCYTFGFYYATISMIGITAEKFAIRLSQKMKFNINGNELPEKDFFGDYGMKQERRLFFLNKSGIIKNEAYKKLIKINGIRNRYTHPKGKNNAKEDSLEVLKLFINMMQSRFSDEYDIKDGKIIKRIY